MASDLFHDVARAYYGVGPEVYTLANIATHGNAPAGYALGRESGAPSQYAGEDETEQPLSPRALYKQYLVSHGAKEVEPGVFELPRNRGREFIQKMDKLGLRPDQQMGTKQGNWKFVLYPGDASAQASKPDFSETGTGTKVQTPESSTGGGYVKPELPPIEKQPKSMPGQKTLFSCSQPYALSDARTTGTGTKVQVPKMPLTGTADDDPQMKRKGADGMYPAQARPVSQSGQRITLPGDASPRL